ncbi:hypothetical protein FGB62_7g315 [Gracilaria domingensis]|nr:hypothetical protein FGB62_7g315 [Gracilaria domingensis]
MANTPHRQSLFQTPHFPSAPDAPPHIQPIRTYTSTNAIGPMAPAENVIPQPPPLINSPSHHQGVQVQPVLRATSNQILRPMSQHVSPTAAPSAPSHITSSDVNATTLSTQSHPSAVDSLPSVSLNQPSQPSSVVDPPKFPNSNPVEPNRHTTRNVPPSSSSEPLPETVSSIAKQVGSQLQLTRQRNIIPALKQQLLSQSSPPRTTAQSVSVQPPPKILGATVTQPSVASIKNAVKPAMKQMSVNKDKQLPST